MGRTHQSAQVVASRPIREEFIKTPGMSSGVDYAEDLSVFIQPARQFLIVEKRQLNRLNAFEGMILRRRLVHDLPDIFQTILERFRGREGGLGCRA